jgi:hypothetical protein
VAQRRIKLDQASPAVFFFFVLIRLSRDVEETLTPTNAIVISVLKISFPCVYSIIDSLGPNGSYVSTFFSHNDTLIHIVGLLLVRILEVTAHICLIVCCCASPAKIDRDAR